MRWLTKDITGTIMDAVKTATYAFFVTLYKLETEPMMPDGSHNAWFYRLGHEEELNVGDTVKINYSRLARTIHAEEIGLPVRVIPPREFQDYHPIKSYRILAQQEYVMYI